MDKTFKDRVQAFILHKGISMRQFEKQANISNGYINNLKSSPSYKIVQKIIYAFPELSVEYLTTGEGSMLNDQEPVTHEIITPEPNRDVAPEIINDLRQRLAKLEQREEQLLQQLAEKDRQISQLLSIMSGSTSYEKESVAL